MMKIIHEVLVGYATTSPQFAGQSVLINYV